MSYAKAIALGVTVVLGCSACAFLRPARTPMPTRYFFERGPEEAAGVILLFPGRGGQIADFERQGFVERLRRYAPEYDLLGVDAHFGYYRTRQLLPRLEADVVGPVVERGYREIWLLGVSLGGLGSVALARTHPEKIKGMLLFAPFLGEGGALDEIASESDLCDWRADPAPADETEAEEFYRDNWRWLRSRFCDRTPGPEVWFGYGEADAPLPAGAMLLEKLGEGRVDTAEGGHGWRFWRPLLDVLGPRAFGS